MSGLIPQPFIDEIISRTDIVEFIDSFVPLKKRGKSHLACCPFHHEKSPSFNVVARKQFYHCFGCGASGNIISFAMNYLHLSFVDAIENLASRLGLQVPREGEKEKSKSNVTYYQLLAKVSTLYQNTLKNSEPAIHYLKSRQINKEMVTQFQIGYAPSAWQFLENEFKSFKNELIATGMLVPKENGNTYDRYRHRIIYPIHDRNGRIIGFGGRSIEKEQKPKYLNSPETVIFQKNRELYGLYQVLKNNATIDSVIIVEGYMDVIALAQFGFTNVVATLGTATSAYHIQLLSKHTKKIIFCFDGDKAGLQAAWRAVESCLPHLNSDLEARFIFLPQGTDPDSLVRETHGVQQFTECIKQAIPFNQFLFNHLTENIDLTSLAGKSQLINAMKPFLQKIPEGSYKQLLLNQLASYTRLEEHRLNELLEEKNLSRIPELGVNISRSPIRLAIALLLQHPEIYTASQVKLKVDFTNKIKHPVLLKLIHQIATHPDINTAHLVELWRDTSLFDSISKLAFWEHQVPEEALIKEFVDIIFFLEKQQCEELIQQLLTKARIKGLSDEERQQLQTLLKKRHLNPNKRSDT